MKPKSPAWVQIYEKWFFKLQTMLSSLEELEGPFISDSELLDIKIDVLTLDFLTGEVPHTSTPYFTPSTREEFTVASSGIDPNRDQFAFYHSTRSSLDGLQLAFRDYSFALFCKYTDNGYWTPSDLEASGMRQHGRRRHYKNVGYVSEDFAKDRCKGGLPHRMVGIEIESLVDGDRLFVTELVSIVRWMVAAMRRQEAVLRSHTIQKAGYLVHMIFPTLLISFLRPACVRVLHAYFDGTTLKVHATKLQNFDAANYTEMMNALLRWRFSTTYWGETLFRKINDKLFATELDTGTKEDLLRKPTRRSKVSFAIN